MLLIIGKCVFSSSGLCEMFFQQQWPMLNFSPAEVAYIECSSNSGGRGSMFIQQQRHVFHVHVACVGCSSLTSCLCCAKSQISPSPHRAPHTWPHPRPPQPHAGDQGVLGCSGGCVRVCFITCMCCQAHCSLQEVCGRVDGCRVVVKVALHQTPGITWLCGAGWAEPLSS